jgi:hypothetical protein
MAQQSIVVSSALVRLYVNNKIYPVTQSVSISQDTGEYAIYGINSPYPQEIAGGGQNMVKGSFTIVRTRNSGGVQAVNLRPLFQDIAASNYISLRLEDRSTGETLWSVTKAKLSNIKETAQAKGIYHISCDFIGQIMFWPLDLS